ncbi:MAG: type II toxin-antitoxin system VapC family toxin [Wenzhouxiangella sp.]|nr:type II toxin-antitoxin system VapC family toxin [Wenzhouxiangella sp.]
MILLDTDVVSEPMRGRPNPDVIRWLNEQDAAQLYVSSITVAEVHFGIAYLPEGQRQRRLRETFGVFLDQAFDSRIVSFHKASAEIYGQIRASHRAQGRPITPLDAQIAAIALENDLSLATRNVKDFDGLDIFIHNPFEA